MALPLQKRRNRQWGLQMPLQGPPEAAAAEGIDDHGQMGKVMHEANVGNIGERQLIDACQHRTPVGNSADSPEPLLRPSPAIGHDAEILDVYDPAGFGL